MKKRKILPGKLIIKKKKSFYFYNEMFLKSVSTQSSIKNTDFSQNYLPIPFYFYIIYFKDVTCCFNHIIATKKKNNYRFFGDLTNHSVMQNFRVDDLK